MFVPLVSDPQLYHIIFQQITPCDWCFIPDAMTTTTTQRFQLACLLRSNTGSAAQRHFLRPTATLSIEHLGQRLEGLVGMVGEGYTHSTSHLRFIHTLSITLTIWTVWTVSSWIKVTENSSFTLSVAFNQQLAA